MNFTAQTSHYIANVPLEGRDYTWQVTIRDGGRSYTSPEFSEYSEMRQWESDWYERNPSPRHLHGNKKPHLD